MREGRFLAGRKALVTGAGRGIGRETALALAGAGARVALVARSAGQIAAVAGEIEVEGGEALALSGDVSEAVRVGEVMDQAWEAWGGIDILVNNAGVIQPVGMSWEVPAEDWLRALLVNLGGAYLCARAFLRRLFAEGREGTPGAKIVNVSTGAAGRPQPGCSAYCASKAGLDHFTRVLAVETADRGVAVNAVYPGMVDTQMMATLERSPPDRFPESEQFSELRRQGKLRPAREVARLILWVASSFSGDRTGQIFRIDDEAIRQHVDHDLGPA